MTASNYIFETSVSPTENGHFLRTIWSGMSALTDRLLVSGLNHFLYNEANKANLFKYYYQRPQPPTVFSSLVISEPQVYTATKQ